MKSSSQTYMLKFQPKQVTLPNTFLSPVYQFFFSLVAPSVFFLSFHCAAIDPQQLRQHLQFYNLGISIPFLYQHSTHNIMCVGSGFHAGEC
jgi:hypothetical protein